MVNFSVATRFVAFATVFSLMACGSKAPEAAKTPEEAAKRVVDGLKANKPVAAWDAMPKQYQDDVKSVITEFANNMDAELYDKAMSVASKAAKLAKDKKDIISKMVPAPVLEQAGGYDQALGLLSDILDSDIKTISSLKGIDPRKFLEGPGSKVMAAAVKQNKDMDFSKFTVAKGEGEGMVKIAGRDMKFIKVGDAWVPEEMSKDWGNMIKEAKAGMAGLKQVGAMKPKVMEALTAVDKALDEAAKAASPEDFQKAFMPVMGQLGPMMGAF